MSEWLRATSPATIVIGPFLSTGATAQTAIECSSATIIDLYKSTTKSDITTTAAGANAMAHIANGYYSLVLTSGNTDTVGPLKITADSAGSMSVWKDYVVVPASIYDSFITGTVTLDSTFAAGAQASSLLAMGVSVASSLVWVASAHAQILVASASAHTNFAYQSTLTTVDTVVDAIKVDTASSLVWVASAHAQVLVASASAMTNLAYQSTLTTVDTVVDSIKVETASSLAKIDILDTAVDAVKVDTASSLVWVASAHAQVLVASASALANLAYQSTLTTVDTVVDSIKVETASSLVWIASAHAQVLVASASAMTNLAYGSAVADISTTAIASAVWDEAIAPHVTSGTTGEALNAAGSAGDPWVTGLPGSYTGTQAGAILAAVNTNMTSSLVWIASAHANIATMDSVVDSIKVETASSLVWIASAHANLVTVDGIVDSIKVETASSLVWIASAHANIANLDSDIVALDSVVDTVKVDTASSLVWIASAHANIANLDSDVAALNNLSAAQVNAQVVDALNVDTYAEPGQEAPAATNTLVKKIGYIFKFLRNKIETTSSTTSVYDDAGTTVDQKSTISDDGTTFTRGEYGTGP